MSRFFSTLASQMAMPTGVPRLVPTAGWPTSHGDEFTIILKIENAGTSSAWWLLEAKRGTQSLSLTGSLGISNALYFGNYDMFHITPPPTGAVEYLLSFGMADNLKTQLRLFVNGDEVPPLQLSGKITLNGEWGDLAGVGSKINQSAQSQYQATVFKVLDGLYTDFATADAVTGPDLIFNGLDF